MAGIGYGVRLCSLTVGALPNLITISKAFNSSGVQVGSTNTGNIPADWVKNETTVTSVIFANDNSVTSIGVAAFGYTNIASITIPSSVLTIGSNAFYYTALTSITIPNSVTDIGSSAFYKCTNIATATIGTGVTNINSNAFSYTALTTITIPNNVLTIGIAAFKECTGLTTATIGTGVTSIGSYAFSGCVNLASVTCRVAQSAFTGSDAFYNTASPLVIQARSTDASWTAGTGLTFQGNTNVTVIKNL